MFYVSVYIICYIAGIFATLNLANFANYTGETLHSFYGFQ